MVLDLDPNRPIAAPRDAATLILVRPGRSGPEVFCVERARAGFLGGAVVFPGGKVDEADRDPSWAERATEPRPWRSVEPADPAALRAFAVAACRESLEEAALLPSTGGPAPAQADLLQLRQALRSKTDTLQAFLDRRGLRLDLAALHPFGRWITPEAESRRFDARFFLVAAEGEGGAHDEHETVASFWARPADVLGRFRAGEIQLAPPTHRVLELLAEVADVSAALATSATLGLEPIRPRLVVHRDEQGETLALTLPGDPEHDVPARRVPGRTRFVLRADRFLPEDPPAQSS